MEVQLNGAGTSPPPHLILSQQTPDLVRLKWMGNPLFPVTEKVFLKSLALNSYFCVKWSKDFTLQFQ